MKASEVLRAAKALVDSPEKWGQGMRGDRPGRSCAGQAIDDVFGGVVPQELKPQYRRCWDLLDSVVDGCLVAWNDAPGRTHAEVLQAFDRAIALAEQEEAARG